MAGVDWAPQAPTGQLYGTTAADNPSGYFAGMGAAKDNRLNRSGTYEERAQRVSDVFGNRGVAIGTADESEQERIKRIVGQIADGRTWDNLRESVDRIATTAPTSAPNPQLPGLSPDDFADISARRRSADAGLQTALANAAAQRGQVESQGALARQQLGEQVESRRYSDMSDLSGAGVGRSPRMAGRAMRSLRDDERRSTGQINATQQEQLAALQAMVNQSEQQHASQLGELDAYEVRRRADLNRLFPGLS